MSRQIAGVLKKPNGEPYSSAVIRFFSIDNTGAYIISGVESSTTTNGAGGYDITLENGNYRVQVGRGVVAGDIIIADGSVVDLPTLLEQA